MKKLTRYILGTLSQKEIWNYLLAKTKYEETDDTVNEAIWKEVFNKVPDIKSWLKKRELNILKSLLMTDKSNDFLKGQLLENKLIQRFDVPSEAEMSKVAEEQKLNIPTKESFLKGWEKPNAEQGK